VRRRAIVVAMVLATASAGLARPARAEPVAHDTAAAEAAFAEARALIRKGQYAEACPRLEASFALDPALGTLLNLSDCFERTGRTASAWVRYREAAAMAVQQGHRERESIARGRIAAHEPKLCRLVVRTSHGPGLDVRRDGVVVERAALGLPVPVDPGTHVITADAPGASTFTSRVEVHLPEKEGSCALTTVEIPGLLDGERTGAVAAAPASSPLPPAAGASPGPPRAEPATPSAWRASHTLAVVAASSGVVAFGVGSFFGLRAASTRSDADAKCTNAGCTLEGKSLLSDAGASADVATVTFIVGAALVATGAVLWITSPSLRAAVASARDLRGGLRF
jgi:hypothetical protein